MNRARAFAFVVAVLASSALAGRAAATTWEVPGDGSNTCTPATPSCDTIQGAVTAASDGDDIQVAAGTFPTATILVNKSLTIAGAGAASTFVEPSGVGFSIAANDVVLQDLTVRNGTQAILFAGSTSNTDLTRLHLTNNSSRGIEITGTVSDIALLECELTNNVIGIRMASTSNVTGLSVVDSTFTDHGLAIYQANDGNTSQLDGLTVSGSSFIDNSDTAALYFEEIRNSVIEESTISGNQRGILIFKFFTGSGVPVENVTIRNNEFSGSSLAAIQIQEQAQGLGGPVDVTGNTIDQDVGLLTANVPAIDVRLSNAFTQAQVSVSDNTVRLSGTFAAATAAYGIGVRGNGPVSIVGNVLDGGGVGGSGTTPPTSGIYVRSNDPFFGALPSGATIDGSCNRITGFTNGISIFDAVNLVPGGLQAGVDISLNEGAISGNSGAGVVNGANPPSVVAESTWWGCAGGPGSAGCDAVVGDVDFTPFASAPPSCVNLVTVAKVTIKAQRGSGGNGKVLSTGSFVTAPPADTIDPSAPITVRAQDTSGVDAQYTFGIGECVAKGKPGKPRIICKSADKKTTATFKFDRKVTDGFKYKIKLGNLAIDAPFAGPVTISFAYGAGIERSGSVAACTAKPTALKCKAP